MLRENHILEPVFAHDSASIAGFRNFLAHAYQTIDPRGDLISLEAEGKGFFIEFSASTLGLLGSLSMNCKEDLNGVGILYNFKDQPMFMFLKPFWGRVASLLLKSVG